VLWKVAVLMLVMMAQQQVGRPFQVTEQQVQARQVQQPLAPAVT
jgi:hypothetical protein